MKLAFSKPTANADETRELITTFRDYGYEGLQLKPGQYSPYFDQPEKFIEDWGAYPNAGSGMIAWCALDDDGQALLHKTIELGSKIGTEVIVYCHNATREGLTPDILRKYAKQCSEFGKKAKDKGLRISIHNHHNLPVMLPEDTRIFFDAVEDNAVGLTVDTAHLVKSGVLDVAGYIRRFAGVIDNFHIKDIINNQFAVLGTGEIDFIPVFAAVREIGYDGWVSADEESGAGLKEGLDGCWNVLRQLVA
ncbi:MAG: sugar phosphate isomerase/epimerase [Armatimonadetes bacterium]|nr:sugar phosphate isomerase/epimerase [Armatimonadota bacterium]